jgi:transcriptional regulator with XRE-family HTH domain
MADAKALGRRIREARSQIGLSPADFARELGLDSDVSISVWETGGRKPRAERLGQIAGVLGVTTDWLLNGNANGATPVLPRRGDFSAALKSADVRQWLLDYRAELSRWLKDEEREEEAYRATVDLAAGSFSVGGSKQEWRPTDSLRVLKAARRRVRRMLGLE